MSDYRTWGETQNCKGCRNWSEMLARAEGGGPVQAICLSAESPNKGKWLTGSQTCGNWQSGELGAVDDPSGNPYEMEIEQ